MHENSYLKCRLCVTPIFSLLVHRPNKILESRGRTRAVPVKPIQPGDTEVIIFLYKARMI